MSLNVKTTEDLIQYVVMRQVFVLMNFSIISRLDMKELIKQFNLKPVKLGKIEAQLTLFEDEELSYISQFEWSVLSHYTVNIFESVKRYCKNSGQLDKMKNKSWYLYFSTVRHSFSHDSRWAFKAVKSEQFPINYKVWTLDKDLEEKPISSKHYSVESFWFLMNDVLDFIKNDLR